MNGHQVELLKDQQEYLRTIEETKDTVKHLKNDLTVEIGKVIKKHLPEVVTTNVAGIKARFDVHVSIVIKPSYSQLHWYTYLISLFQWIKEHITRKKTMSNQELLESLTV